ncbi:hypothetical protein SLA2020_465580, partial [Shorea laevis]
MSVREKLSLFENCSSIQEIDLLDQSIKKIKESETNASTESSRRGDTLLNGEPSNSSIKDVVMTIRSADEKHQDTPMSESQNPATSSVNQTQNSLSYRDKLMGEENPIILSFNT